MTQGSDPRHRARPLRPFLLGAAGVLLLAAAVSLSISTGRPIGPPSPVADPQRFADRPEVARIYREAAEIPDLLRTLECRCPCPHRHEHQTLLDCFRSEHGANCDICMSIVDLAWRMRRDGKSDKEIRDAVAAAFTQPPPAT